MGSLLIAARFARQGHDIVAAGFALLALAEGINMTSMFEEFTAGFAAGTAVYVVALLLASLPPALPLWVRILGTLAVIPFAAHATLFLLGQNPAPSGFFASVGYAVLTLTVIGWIISVLRATPAAQQ
jgi:Na+-translocating ferredoxin:NAD+ oxidoreductase RnfD subunit